LFSTPNPLELTPLYPGYGTHFAFLYVGTPPVRQAVIIDTGSSFTAFPCLGCNKCGQHVSKYFDPEQSTSAVVQQCGQKKKEKTSRCTLNEHYSEGSSWEAYKVTDTIFVGGNDPSVLQGGAQYAVDYDFGCMTAVTGLFETQLADGIMGLSRHANSLPQVLQKRNVTASAVFSLCLETGNGILTLGGVDQSLHKKREKIQYAKLLRNTEYWSVQISAVQLGADNAQRDFRVLNKGGVIFDSGSTDTVLPVALRPLFTKMIPEMKKMDKQNQFVCTRDLLRKLPPVVIDLVGIGGNWTVPRPVHLSLSPAEYLTMVDSASNTYELSIYFDDAGGVILGANAMSGYNTIFDGERNRVGFVPAKCRFEDYVYEPDPVMTMPPTATPKDGEATNSQKRCENSAYSSCSAKCTRESPRQPYAVNGSQYFDCNSDETKPCVELCSRSNQVQRGASAACLNSFWTECSAECSQTRVVATLGGKSKDKSKGKSQDKSKEQQCLLTQETRSCYIDQCPSKDGDILIFSDA
jgi:hypothetical protein